MRKLSVAFLLFIFFIGCSEKKEKEGYDENDLDQFEFIDKDDEEIDEEVVHDFEEDEEIDEGTDEEIVDDFKDESIIDDEPFEEIDPCDSNPCTEENRTICEEVDGEAVCSCDENFHDEEGVCIENIKTVSCDEEGVNPPQNGSIEVIDVEVFWSDEEWSEPARCDWKCDNGFQLEGEECVNSPFFVFDFDEEGDYVTGTEFHVKVEVNSQGYVETLYSISHAFFKDGGAVAKMSDVTSKAQYTVRSQGNNYVSTPIVDGAGTIKAQPVLTTFEAFTLGIFDTYCVNRNRPINVDVNFKEPGKYRLELELRNCSNNGKKIGTNFVADNCDGKKHDDKAAEKCENPQVVNVQSVEFEVREP
ncbi:MAG: hypothetical protein ACOX2F_12385 [bacterium]